MLWRISQLFSGGGDLLRAEAEIAAKRMRRAAIAGAVAAIGLLAALVGLLIAVAGGSVALAGVIGWAGSLLVVGTLVLVIGLAMAMVARKKNKGEEPSAKGFRMPPEVQATQAKHQMHEAVDPKEKNPNESHDSEGGESGGSDSPDFGAIKDKAIDFAAKNPAAVASGAFLALSIIGPFRAFKMISRGAALASMAAAAVDHFKQAKGEKSLHDSEPRAAYSRTSDDPTGTNASTVRHTSTGTSEPFSTNLSGGKAEPRSPMQSSASRPEVKPGAWSGARSPSDTAPGRDRL
jgi:hypothetical protein